MSCLSMPDLTAAYLWPTQALVAAGPRGRKGCRKFQLLESQTRGGTGMGVFYDHIVFDYWPNLHRVLEANRPLRVAAKAGGYAGLFLLVALTVASYESLDESGWITHDHDTPTWIQGDWLQGEYRTCDMPVRVVRLFCGRTTAGGRTWQPFPIAFRTMMLSPHSAPQCIGTHRLIGPHLKNTSMCFQYATWGGSLGRNLIPDAALSLGVASATAIH